MASADGWEDDLDEDDADLFSFGTDAAPPADTDTTKSAGTPVVTPAAHAETTDARERTGTDDSFLDLLQEADKDMSFEITSSEEKPAAMDDKETKEILEWLDEEGGTGEAVVFGSDGGDKQESNTGTSEKTSSTAASEAMLPESKTPKETAATTKTSKPPQPTIVAIPPEPPAPKPIVFETLEEALYHPKSTVEQVRSLFVQGGMKVDAEHRPQLWCRTVCSGKTLDQINTGSVAGSFVEWREHKDKSKTETEETEEDQHSAWIRKEASLLAERIVVCDTNRSLEQARKDLCDVLLFHYQSSNSNEESEVENDPLLPPVAAALLSAAIPTPAASVMLTNIMPAFMPLLALTHNERWEAAKSLHAQFYLLACYHLPLLVFHLDRYAPGWHWPKTLGDNDEQESSSATEKGRNLQAHGVVPQSWLISHLAGECGGTLMNPKWLLSLWDLILTSSNNSLRFFLSLAVLEKHSDSFLMLTGSELVDELDRIMEFKEGTTPEGFAIEGEEEVSDSEAVDWVQEWCARARTLWESTPRTVVSRLRSAEDDAVKEALTERRKEAERKLKARLEAEAEAHREAVEAEAEEARLRLSRARLVAFYRKHAPDKEGNIDKILKTYEGRLDVLDKKLKSKYGSGFNPALKPKLMTQNSTNLLSTMNQGFGYRRAPLRFGQVSSLGTEEASEAEEKKESHVAVAVSATEILPIICWSKEAAAKRSATTVARGRYSEELRAPLKFFLVDSRPDETVQEQGRFPTAASMSPEALLDPERIGQIEDMFESLRGAVHICVMGEGFSAVPGLYGQKVNGKLEELIAEDESRTSLCALFFVKKGFPFVSVLEGGFVAAHAWLCREGPDRHLNASSVLVDYDPDNSLFGQMEAAYKKQQEFANAPAREKAQRVMQNMFDASMTSLTRNKYRIENIASELETTEGRQKVRDSVSKFFAKKEEQKGEAEALSTDDAKNANQPGKEEEDAMETIEIDPDATSSQTSKKGNLFRNPFAGRRSVVPDKSSLSVDETAVDFAPVEENMEKAPTPPTTSPFARFTKGTGTTSKPEGKDKVPGPPAASPFARFTMRTGSTTKPEGKENAKDAPSPPSSSPFARFTKGAKSVSSNDEDPNKSEATAPQASSTSFGRFAGIGSALGKSTKNGDAEGSKASRFGGINVNQLTLNTLSSLRGKAAQEEVRTASSAAEVEESISFFDNDSPVSSKKENESAEPMLSAVSQDGGVTEEVEQAATAPEETVPPSDTKAEVAKV